MEVEGHLLKPRQDLCDQFSLFIISTVHLFLFKGMISPTPSPKPYTSLSMFVVEGLVLKPLVLIENFQLSEVPLY